MFNARLSTLNVFWERWLRPVSRANCVLFVLPSALSPLKRLRLSLYSE